MLKKQHENANKIFRRNHRTQTYVICLDMKENQFNRQ